MVGVVIDWICPDLAPCGVDIPEAGECCPGEAFISPDHSLKSFPNHSAAIAGADNASRDHRLNYGGVKEFLWRS